ncbi:MAG: histidinol-phosphate transaminase [Sideroxydans sp.]|nr:histidinol-phosphate transaminase [Sideroxydans sp.]
MSTARTLVTPKSLIRPEVLALSAYHVPPSSGFIKLDAMENPYGLPAELRAELSQAMSEAAINRYPDASAFLLKEDIRRLTGLPDGMDVLLGNGSDEIIQILAMALAQQNAVLLSVEPSFVMYKMIATFCGMRYVGVPLAEDFSLDLKATLVAIEREQPALVFLAYPNNPTGNLFDAEAVKQIIQASPGLVIVDEAYYAFASDSFIPLLSQFNNLLVMRTYSKLGMAGLRLGFLAGPTEWLSQFEKLRLPYNVGVLPQLVVRKLLQHHDVLLSQAAEIKLERTRLLGNLAHIEGIKTYPSEANFILLRVKRATDIFEGLKQRHILIKNLSGGHPALNDCLRVTVGAAQENDSFIAALKDTINQLAQG